MHTLCVLCKLSLNFRFLAIHLQKKKTFRRPPRGVATHRLRTPDGVDEHRTRLSRLAGGRLKESMEVVPLQFTHCALLLEMDMIVLLCACQSYTGLSTEPPLLQRFTVHMTAGKHIKKLVVLEWEEELWLAFLNIHMQDKGSILHFACVLTQYIYQT